ncbi:hypothetical protein J6590_074130, partial [Homalodisca vitripennis]
MGDPSLSKNSNPVLLPLFISLPLIPGATVSPGWPLGAGGHSVTREALRSRERYLDIGKAPARPGSVSGINNAFVKEKNIADATIFLR